MQQILSASTRTGSKENIAHPEHGTLELQHRHHEQEQPSDNRSLDAERLDRAVLQRPRDLEVRDTEPAERTREVDEPRDLALHPRETVVEVGVCVPAHNMRDGRKTHSKGLTEHLQTATVLIMTATSAMPQPMTSAPTLRCFWKEAPSTTNPQMYSGTAM